MADRPFEHPLPADLPEDWTSGQTIAPAGADVGLSLQHGYNYLMEQVNAAQRAANAINASFDSISGKRTCRFVVGTSTAGWTEADCDYLCDGTNDQEEIQAAMDAAQKEEEIVLLSGTYRLSAPITIKPRVELIGNGMDATKLELGNGSFSGSSAVAITCYGSMRNLEINDVSDVSSEEDIAFLKTLNKKLM